MNSTTIAIEKYLKTDTAKNVRKELEAMFANPMYSTESSYSPSSEDRVTFVNKHMHYLSMHQKINPEHYLSNLRLMTKVR